MVEALSIQIMVAVAHQNALIKGRLFFQFTQNKTLFFHHKSFPGLLHTHRKEILSKPKMRDENIPVK